MDSINIEGVRFKELVTHSDDRGFFREIIRSTDDFFKEGFGQMSYSLVNTGVIKAWHGHKYQTQWTFVMDGEFYVAIHDFRKDSPTYRNTVRFYAGRKHKPLVYSFPPGVAHGYKCLSGPAFVIYVTSGTYDTADEVRINESDRSTGINWEYIS